MCSAGALTVMAVVPEYVGFARRASPAMTRARSDGVVPHWFIHRRIGNQYSAATVIRTRSVRSIGFSSCLGIPSGTVKTTSVGRSIAATTNASVAPLEEHLLYRSDREADRP